MRFLKLGRVLGDLREEAASYRSKVPSASPILRSTHSILSKSPVATAILGIESAWTNSLCRRGSRDCPAGTAIVALAATLMWTRRRKRPFCTTSGHFPGQTFLRVKRPLGAVVVYQRLLDLPR